ncbi:M20 family metallopeptidase [Desulfothermus okinawensis]
MNLISFFRKIVEINTYSYNLDGIYNCLEILANNVPTSLNIEQKNRNLVISNVSKNYILLMGHIDTVFPEDLGFNKFLESKEKIFGPGVFDMKGGLIVALFSLIYLGHLGLLKDLPVVFLINSDEEIGSIHSKELIESYARKARCGFVFEGAGENGEVVVGRKGKIGLKIETTGQASHAAYSIQNKPSAILEMARKIIEIEELNDKENGISANAGKIEGGIGPNTVPESCTLLADFRFSKEHQENELMEKVRNICENNKTPGVSSIFSITSKRPCMEPEQNMGLYEVIREASKDAGVKVDPQVRPGVSDANFIARCNTPVIDGMGPVGGRDHSTEEFIIKSSIPERILLTTFSILKAKVTLF